MERSHREDQEKLYDKKSFNSEDELKYDVRLWNMYYNDLEHCGLNGKTPNEFLANYQLINPPNVPKLTFETQFMEFLQKLSPNKDDERLFKAIVIDAWKTKLNELNQAM